DNQKECFKRDIFIMKKHGFCVNTSTMGQGKSIVACMAGIILNKRICVITPTDTLPTWLDLYHNHKEFCIDYIYTNKGISGTISKPPTGINGQLLIGIKEMKREKAFLTYDLSRNVEYLISQGYLFIMDEVHSGKNDSLTNRSMSCISSNIIKNYNSENNSMVFFTTATLSDKDSL